MFASFKKGARNDQGLNQGSKGLEPSAPTTSYPAIPDDTLQMVPQNKIIWTSCPERIVL